LPRRRKRPPTRSGSRPTREAPAPRRPARESLGQLINDENNLTSIPNPPDTINVPAGIYVLTLVQLPATESVTIDGAGPRTTRIQTTSCSGGGLSNDGGTLTLTDSLVWNNSSTDPHGEGKLGRHPELRR
jgi:hypothetical protein